VALTPVEIRHVRLGKRLFGYSKDEADRLLEEIADSFEDVWRDRADLADKVEKVEADLVRYKETEQLLRTTLVSAERSAAEQRAQAQREADLIVQEAHAEARAITRQALGELERLQTESRRVRGLLQSALMAMEPAIVEVPEPTGEDGAEIVAQDFELGLALLKVKRTGLASVPVASSERLERGQSVFALGSTGPRERRVAGGLLTYLGEFVAYWEYLLERSLVCSASNPGFGGGPLFTVAGRMVGVVSLNLSEIGRCSLAIPGECFEQNRAEYLRYGRAISRPQRAWLGVFAHPLDEGVVVAGLVPNGPGARSGIQEGDVIVSLDARQVPTQRDLYLSLWRRGPGERIALEVMRDNELKRLDVTGGDRADFYKQIP